MTLPRNVFVYWHQGLKDAPPPIGTCLRRLESLHQDWRVHALDSESVNDFIEEIPIPPDKWRKLPLPHQSDVIRTQLLFRHGGVWADPTVWFRESMSHWLAPLLDSGLFMFTRPGRDRLISNWFIAAYPKNYLIGRLYDGLCAFWRENDFRSIGFTQRRSINLLARLLHRNTLWPQVWLSQPVQRTLSHAPYMIYHYLFARLVRTDIECRKVWKRTPQVSAIPPHILLRHGLLSPMANSISESLTEVGPPVFKLTWKLAGTTIPDDCVLDCLQRKTENDAGREKQQEAGSLQ